MWPGRSIKQDISASWELGALSENHIISAWENLRLASIPLFGGKTPKKNTRISSAVVAVSTQNVNKLFLKIVEMADAGMASEMEGRRGRG